MYLEQVMDTGEYSGMAAGGQDVFLTELRLP
jgi:hypothetical protein